MIETTDLCKSYVGTDGERIDVLNGISLTVPAGTFAAVVGPSGSGKSTLLLILGALLQPDGGSVRVAGRDLCAMPDSERAASRAGLIGFVFQRFHLLPYLTVRENILSASVGLPRAAADSDARADTLMRELGIAHRREHRPGRLSVGEMQRTALARALLNGPEILLADEPTGNLDRKNAGIVLGKLAEFAGGGGTVLMVTHSSTAAGHANSVWNLEHGRIG
ncbi:MAG: ABC transporter ATP-binding protein [Kiritimatiellae bacterium]|nr:ABC transporter ATP-binding protein [Kiritimatiellia bacterium]